MKNLLLLLLLLLPLMCFSQENEPSEESKDGWKKTGKITLLINQSAFSNWQAGGDNNFAGNLNLNYDLNYLSGDWSLDNKILASYGLTNSKDDGTRKTDDRLELNSILGKKLKESWSASFFMNFKTQFTDGYDYEDDFMDQNPTLSNEDFPASGFFKPAYWSFGPGLLWKKNDNLYFNISPLTAKFTFITSEIYSYNENTQLYESSNDIETFGVDPGDSFLVEVGFNARAYYKFDIMNNISMENILNLFSNYIDKPQNIDLDYTLNLVMKINDIFTTNLTFQTIYDDNAFNGFQIREVFGLGVNVNL
ncbi:DUF3078 domain-containing protein [Flavobacteriaceae bacterium]|nr:DUF3078 domain-containing protein [Flavobacteriaceae bacterium]